jgi:hypothetical protein
MPWCLVTCSHYINQSISARYDRLQVNQSPLPYAVKTHISWLDKKNVVCDETINKSDILVTPLKPKQIYKTGHIPANHGHTFVHARVN